MLDALIGRLIMSGVAARAAIADSWGAAHALALCGGSSTCVAPPGHGASVLSALPLEALRLPRTMSADLGVLGFERIGDLLVQPRAPLTLRFGPQLGRRIDQALDHLAEPIEPVRPPDLISVRRAFPEPIGAAETIARYIGKLRGKLCEALEEKELGARRLDLLCQRVDNRLAAVRVGMAQPVRDVKRLTRLLCDKIEAIDPGFGIEAMTLTATIAKPLERKQLASSLVEFPSADISDLIDTLANRVGERAIYRMGPVASDVPERSVCRIPALAPRAARPGQAIGRVRHGSSAAPKRSRPSRSCRTIRRSPSPGAASAAG